MTQATATASWWQGDPATALALVATMLLYLQGRRELAAYRSGPAVLPRWRVRCFHAGLLVMAVALVGPVDVVAEDLFWVHMVQHQLLALAAPPLLVLGRAGLVIGRALPRSVRRVVHPRRWTPRALRSGAAVGVAAAGVHAGTWWLWHLPGPYDLALRWDAAHVAEHVLFLGSGVVLWSVILRRRSRISLPAALLSVLAAMLPTSVLAGLLTFSARSWYGGHRAGAWGLTPLEDQQLGAALMWFPGSLSYLAVAAVVVFRGLTPPTAPPPTGLGGAGPAGALAAGRSPAVLGARRHDVGEHQDSSADRSGTDER
ncbi:cytochrome c oxidase assembly protein [Micromonospora sp. WMMD558]|uniref:cytochrome c oxidase assembly protein n=1 Tax=unclassified Micromonospora TaxID=2617518 RepID=UPI0012B4A95C|nr:cytochrome c oxidase assembly protein [Micromonospora sp. WMMC415]QGN49901.1 hypothetical protein GKC29_25795 [Micromonospora sp. WMMC415]